MEKALFYCAIGHNKSALSLLENSDPKDFKSACLKA